MKMRILLAVRATSVIERPRKWLHFERLLGGRLEEVFLREQEGPELPLMEL